MDSSRPIPGIRLKAHAEGCRITNISGCLAKKSSGKSTADELVNGIIYKRPFGKRSWLDIEIWKNNSEEWDKVRIAVGERIAK
jgi:hypothetical protein